MRTGVWAALLLAGLLTSSAAMGQVAPRETTDEDVDRVIEEISRFVLARQNGQSGLWPHHHWHQQQGGFTQGVHAGTTALALFALQEAGLEAQDENVKRGLEALCAVETNNTYIRSVRTIALSLAVHAVKDSVPLYLDTLRKDVEWLTKKANTYGSWGYGGAERDGDNSCSQFALLALWEADRAGIEVPQGIIRKVESTWISRQQPDRGWTYAGIKGVAGGSTNSMTSAALASLFVCRDITSLAASRYKYQDELDKGWGYLVENLKKNYIDDEYLAFCVQRMGMASGQKFIGTMDWFKEGADVICRPNPYGRQYKGQWGADVRACFELIFLARGRIPLTFNKLEHGDAKNWNYYDRDVPRFTEYMRREYEQQMRWQVVKITDDVQEMLDAPLLLVTGIDALTFTKDDWDKLREYSLRGGTLLFIATNRSSKFIESVKAGLGDLFASQREGVPEHYRLEKLPADHPIYTVKHEIPLGDRTAPTWGVSDGTRLLAILCERDICESWQKYARRTGEVDYQLGGNFFFYATGGNPMRSRMRPVFAGKGERIDHRIKVGWVRHGGNWSSQPHALQYISDKLTAENRAAIDLTRGVPLNLIDLQGYHILWMTGSREFELSEKELAALRMYLNGGGTLFVNAVGGSSDFHKSARKMFDDLFANEPVSSGLANPDGTLMTGKCGDFRGPNLNQRKLERTGGWIKYDSKPVQDLQLEVFERDRRIVAIYGRYGVHDTLDGHAGHGAMSYLPSPARDIAANIVLQLFVDSKVQAAATQPAAPPAQTAAGEQ